MSNSNNYPFKIESVEIITEPNLTKGEYKKPIKIIEKVGGYPIFPKNEFEEVEFKYAFNIIFSKKIIYQRLLEWGALSFTNINFGLHYQDFDSGKIICKGYFELPYEVNNIWGKPKGLHRVGECYVDFVFTIKEGSFKVQFRNVRYKINSYYWWAATTDYIEFSSRHIYPIADNPPREWYPRMSILHNTTKYIDRLSNSIFGYVRDRDKDYIF